MRENEVESIEKATTDFFNSSVIRRIRELENKENQEINNLKAQLSVKEFIDLINNVMKNFKTELENNNIKYYPLQFNYDSHNYNLTDILNNFVNSLKNKRYTTAYTNLLPIISYQKTNGIWHSINKQKEEEDINRLRSDLDNLNHEIDEIKNKKQDFEKLIHELINKNKIDFQKWSDDFIKNNEEFYINNITRIDELINEKQQEFINIEESYKQHIKIKAAIKYWDDLGVKHKWRGVIWSGILILLASISICLLYEILYNPPEIFNTQISNFEPGAIKALLIFGTIVSIIIYSIRVSVKMIFSHFHQQMDANERSSLTFVYLALIKDGAIKEEERDIVLQSLFSRVDTGLIGKDSSPAIPNATLDSLFRKIKG